MAQVDKKEIFETMPVRKALMTMAIPTIISQLINLIYNIVDTFWIGRTGNAYMIASISVSFMLFLMNIAFSNLFGIGGGSHMARLLGIDQKERASHTSAFSLYGALCAALLYSAFILIFLEPLLNLLGASNETMGYAKQYVVITVVIGNIPTIVSMTLAHLLRNTGYSKQASIGLSGGGILNLILDPLFMFVLLPHGYEVAGAALATMVSNLCACIYLFCTYVSLTKTTILEYRLSSALKIEKQDLKRVFSVGVPCALLNAFYDIANIVLTATMSAYGDFALAAIGITHKIERLPNAICVGICQGALPIIAYNYSSGNRERMKKVINTTRLYGYSICIVCIGFLYAFAKPFSSLFINTNTENSEGAFATLAYAITFLRIRCFQSPFQFMNYQNSFCMQAMGDGRDTFIHSFCRQLVFYIPFMLILNRFFGLYGLVSAVLLGELCGGLTASILLKHFIKKSQIKV